MNAKQELQDLLAKVDRHFVVDGTQYHDKDVIVGTIAGQPARLAMRTELRLSTSSAQVVFQVVMNDNAVHTWGCVDARDTAHLVEWFLLKHDRARQDYYKLRTSMKDVWTSLK